MNAPDIWDIPGLVELFLGLLRQGKKPAEAAKEVVAQRLPKMFGIGREDEAIFESLRQLLPRDKRGLIDAIIGVMKDYEADIFRLTVAGMPCGNELVDGKPQSWEFVPGKDLRARYLEEVADEMTILVSGGLTKAEAALQAVDRMRSRRLITRNPFAQKVHEIWADTTEWIEKELLGLFGVESFSEITPAMVAHQIDRLTAKIPYVPRGQVSPSFWRWAFARHPVATSVLILVAIIVTITLIAIS